MARGETGLAQTPRAAKNAPRRRGAPQNERQARQEEAEGERRAPDGPQWTEQESGRGLRLTARGAARAADAAGG